MLDFFKMSSWPSRNDNESVVGMFLIFTSRVLSCVWSIFIAQMKVLGRFFHTYQTLALCLSADSKCFKTKAIQRETQSFRSRTVTSYATLFRNNVGYHTSLTQPIVQCLFVLHQLTHEVEVGGDDIPLGFDQPVDVHHGQFGVFQEVSNGDGSGARHSRVAVD